MMRLAGGRRLARLLESILAAHHDNHILLLHTLRRRDGIDRGLWGRQQKRGVVEARHAKRRQEPHLGASTLSLGSRQGGLAPSTVEALRHRPEATSRGDGPRLPCPRLDGATLDMAHAMEPKLHDPLV